MICVEAYHPALHHHPPIQSHLLAPGRWAKDKVPLPPTFTRDMLKAKMQGVGLDANVHATVASAHELLSRCSGGKGLSGIVPTNRAPQPAPIRLS